MKRPPIRDRPPREANKSTASQENSLRMPEDVPLERDDLLITRPHTEAAMLSESGASSTGPTLKTGDAASLSSPNPGPSLA